MERMKLRTKQQIHKMTICYTSTYTMYIYLQPSAGERKGGIQKYHMKLGRRKGQMRGAINFEKVIIKSLKVAVKAGCDKESKHGKAATWQISCYCKKISY